MSTRLGAMLVELLLAIAVATVALVALVSLSSRAVSDAGYFRHKTEATAFAREGIEWVKNQKESLGWSFVDGKKGSTYCISSLAWGTLPCATVIPGTTLYTRTITLTEKTPETRPPRLVAEVNVVWPEAGGKTFSAMLTTELTNF